MSMIFKSGRLLKTLLDKESIRHHCIHTPNGYQFVFKASEETTKAIKMNSKLFTQIGVVIDTKVGTTRGYIVFPTENTENRYILSQSTELDELPFFLRPIWQKKADYEFPIPVENGSRDDSLYHFAARLNRWGIPREEAEKSMDLIYEYFVLDKTDFPEKQLRAKIRQGYNWEPNESKSNIKWLPSLVPELEEEQGENQIFKTNKQNKIMVCLHNTQIILKLHEIEVYYDVIKKRSLMKSTDYIFNGSLSDYHVVKIMDYALNFNYKISKNICADHLMAIAKDNSINKVEDFFECAKSNWDGVSRIEDVFNTLHSRTDRKLGLAYFKKFCIQVVRLAFNHDGEMNQEFVLVLQGGQGAGKTTWFKQLFAPIGKEYFKEGLDLNPDNKDSILECVSHFAVELGELDATMKHEQSKLKAFITRSWDEIRKPFERLAEITPRQTVLCATVNEEDFLKDKTGNRRYAIIKTDGEIDRFTNIDLEQFWGEIATLEANGESHHLTKAEKEQQQIDNNNYETLNEAEIRVEVNFQWGVDKKYWREITTAVICEVLGLPKKSKNVAQALRNRGCEYNGKVRPRTWTVPPFINDYSNVLPSGIHPPYKE